jgi:hypothetical protein
MNKAYAAFDSWMRNNAPLVIIALALASISAWWNVRSIYDDEQYVHARDCDSLRARSADVLTYYTRTASLDDSHADDENRASLLWARIVGDFARAKITDPYLARDIAGVSGTWTHLADADSSKATGIRDYIGELEADYNKSCGPTPTPRPIVTR